MTSTGRNIGLRRAALGKRPVARVVAPPSRGTRRALRLMAAPFAAMLAAGTLAAAPGGGQRDLDGLRKALTFYASFDGTVDAARAAGDPALYWAPSFKERGTARAGLPGSGEIRLEKGAGKSGDALRFAKKQPQFVFFKGERNVAYQPKDWNGSVSFWLSVDPAGELEPGFCDPIQITPRAWNDAAFFVEFEKRPESIPFRLGVYADLNVWNPQNRKFAEIPPNERPLVTVEQPPFARGRWTHVVFTFERFNSGRPDGVARLYLDGAPRGTLSPRQQTFTWDPQAAIIAMGLGYVGMLDELSVFDRALTEAEVRGLHLLAAPLVK